MIDTPHNARAVLKSRPGGMTVNEMAAELGVTPAGAYQVLQKFCYLNFAKRRREPGTAPEQKRKYLYFIDGTDAQFAARYGAPQSAPTLSSSAPVRDVWQMVERTAA